MAEYLEKEATLEFLRENFKRAYNDGYAAGMKAAEEKIAHCRECVCYHSSADVFARKEQTSCAAS